MDETQIFLPSQHVRTALRALGGSPALLEAVMAGSGLTPQLIEAAQFRFPVSALWPMSENVASLLGPGWFLNFPALWSFEVHSEFGLAIRSAPDLGSAFTVIVEFAAVHWPIGHVLSRHDKAAGVLEITSLVVVSALNWQFLSSLVALNFQTLAGSINPEAVGKIQIRFRGEPPAYVDALNAVLRIPSSWNNPAFEIVVPDEVMSTSSNFRDERTHAAMISVMREEMRNSKRADTVKAKVMAILNAVSEGRLHVDAVALAMGLSARTLERRLLREGTSLRELQDESLKMRFYECVSAVGNPSAAQIAFKLGYQDAASLNRACKRWFGMTIQNARREFLRQKSTPIMLPARAGQSQSGGPDEAALSEGQDDALATGVARSAPVFGARDPGTT